MKKIFLLFMSACICQACFTQWITDSTVNLEVSALTSSVILTAPTSTGGTFISTYTPNGSGFYDMAIQYLDASGAKQLGPNGLLLNSYPANTATFVYNVMVDAQNNFIVCFQDQRNGLSNGVVAYKINTLGQSLWETTSGTGDGLLLGVGLSPYPCQLTDGDYIVAWNNTTNNRINYQKVKADGTLAWAVAKEITPITAGRTITRPQVVPHTANKWGMVFQQRNGTVGSPTPTTLFERQFDSAGAILWTSTALSSAVTSSTRYYSVLGNGDDTYIGYYANPAAQSRFDGFVQRVNGDGSLPWGVNGSDFSTEQFYYESTINIVFRPAANEVWAVETFSNSGQSQYGIYTQRFDAATGSRLLTDNAQVLFPVSTAREQTWPTNMGICTDGGLMLMFYSDVSNFIYASKIDAAGSFVWPSARYAINATANAKGRYNFSVAGNQGVAVWQETRAGSTRAYAQNITCAGITGGIFPVKLEYFRGAREGNQHLLAWKVNCTNTQYATMTLEISGDGRNYRSLYSSKETVLRCLQPFEYTNASPFAGINYYRLKMTDDNGILTYSAVVALMNTSKGADLMGIAPNPVTNGVFKLNISAAAPFNIDVHITDSKGLCVYKQTVQVVPGWNAVEINAGRLAAGSYQLFGITPTGSTKTCRLIIQ